MRKSAVRTLAAALALSTAVVACSHHGDHAELSQSDRSGPLPLPPESVLGTENDGGKAAGSTPGGFTVTPDGAAAYSIPLWVPPGRAGIEPELALQYDSRGGDGMLGVGWSLRGLPEISRCKKRLANDGFAGPLTYDNADPYCLDGHRLVLVAGTHNHEGAEYRTERDSFTKVVAHAPDALGPTSFTGYLKDGRVLTFGDNGVDRTPTLEAPRVRSDPPPPNGSIYTDPNVIAQTQTVRLAWAVGSVEDRAGNLLRVHYAQPQVLPPPGMPGSARMLYPSEIDYTDARAPAKNAQARRSVRFVYKPLHDSFGDGNGYLAGLPWWHGQRLDRIDMYGPNPVEPLLLRSYQLAYTTPSVTGRLLLQSVTEKDAAGIALGATTFEWEKGSTDWEVTPTGITDISKDPRYRWLEIADINGDGKSDLVYIRDGAPTPDYYIRLSDGTQLGPPIDSIVSFAKSGHPPLALDYNHDGRDDLLLYVDHYPPGNNAPPVDKEDTPCVGRTVGIGGNANKPSFVLGPCFPDRRALAGDLNGDGLSDLLTFKHDSPKDWQYQLNLAPGGALGSVVGFTGPLDTVATLSTPNQWELEIVDVDGDGAGELVGTTPKVDDQRRTVWELGRQPRNPPLNFYQGTLYNGVDLFFGDVNGDGLPDAIAWDNDVDHVDSFVNTGNGYGNWIQSSVGATVPPNNKIDSGIRVLDWDGDGRSDLMLRAAAGGLITPGDHVVIMRSIGGGFVAATNLPSQVTAADTGLVQPLDLDGNGLDDLLLYDNGQLLLYRKKGKKPDLLTRITNGVGAVTTVRYEPVSNPEVYTPGKSCAWPQSCVKSGLWVVAEHASSNGNGGMNAWQYRYADGRSDVRGRGFIGMSARTITYAALGRQIAETYDLSLADDGTFYPRAGVPASVTETVTVEAGVTRTHRVDTGWAVHTDGHGVYFPWAQTIDASERETRGAAATLLASFHTVRVVDDFDNLVDLTHTANDGQSYHYHADYENLPDAWLVERVSLVEETSVGPNGESATRRRGWVWDPLGYVAEEVLEPGSKSGGGWLPRVPQPGDDGVKTLYRVFERTAQGLVKREYLDETDGAATAARRSVDYTWAPDDESIFVASRTDALGHKIRNAWHAGLGARLASDDDNNLLTTWTVDRFGRVRLEKSAGRDSRAINYGFVPGTPQARISETLASGPKSITDYDALDRPAQLQSLTRKDGQWVVTEVQYDDAGRGLRARSLPHFVFEQPLFSTFEYDNLGRVRFHHGADGGTTELRYDGLVTSRFDPKGHERRVLVDALGHVAQSTEIATSGVLTTEYAWGPFSTLRTVVDPANNRTDIGWDRLGRKRLLADPDAGAHEYSYTVFGELYTETVNGADKATYSYDNAGRLTQVDSKDGATRWIWDFAANGIGLVGQTVSPDGVTTRYGYDAYARLRDTTWTAGQSQLTITRDYDGYGRLRTLWYPAVPGRPTRFAVDYWWAPQGNLDQVTPHGSPAGSKNAYYTVVDSDAAGQPTNPSGAFRQARLGNGVTTRVIEDPGHRGFAQRIEAVDAAAVPVQRLELHFDLDGNLETRNDALAGLSESFGYDASDRLTGWSWQGNGLARDTTFDYDDIGNLRARRVAQDGALDVDYSYDRSTGGGPHAVSARNGQPYGYDGRGEQTSGPDRTVDYTWFELPSRITTPAAQTRFAYDAARQRVLKRSSDGELWVTAGGRYELHQRRDTLSHVFTVEAQGAPVAQVVWRQVGGQFAPDVVQYLHVDPLGSVDTISDAKGGIAERLKYDPYGARVDATRLDRPLGAAPTSLDRAGFTGHEQDDELGLVNMKGRVYDPQLGRFLTPDPVVGDPLYGQALNRYAYVGNNPTSFTDPSGFVKDGDQAGVVDGWPVSGVVYFSTSNPPPPGKGPSQSKRTQHRTYYDPNQWDVIQLDLVPDPPAPPKLKYPNHPRAQARLDYARRFYDTADHVSSLGDFDTVEDKDGNILIWSVSGRPGAVSSAVQIEDLVFAAGIIKSVGKAALKAAPRAYSVAYETVIEATGAGTRRAHNIAANKALLRDIAADPEFAKAIKELGIEVPEDLGRSPSGWPWHHVPGRPGTMQLVPKDQHWGSAFQKLIHPNRRGGFSEWGQDF